MNFLTCRSKWKQDRSEDYRNSYKTTGALNNPCKIEIVHDRPGTKGNSISLKKS